MSIISRLVALALILSCADPALADGIVNPGGSSGGATTIASGTTPITGGADTQVCFNDGGFISCGNAALTFAKATGNLASTTYNKVTITAPATGSTLTIANGKVLTASNTLTFTATDGSTLAIGTGGTLGTAAYQNTGTSGANLPFLNGANTWSGNQSIASANSLDWNADTVLSRFGAGILGLSNSTNASKLLVYSTTDSITSPTNYSRVIVDAGTTAATFKIGSEHGGSGTAMTKFALVVDGTIVADYGITAGSWFTTALLRATTSQIANLNNADNGVTAFATPSGANVTFSVGSATPLFRFAGTTSSFPAFKRSTTTIIARLADDSADTTFQSGQLILSGIGSDATHTDSTVCQDTTSHQFYAGSGAAGICLGTSSVRFKTDLAPLAAGLDELLRVDTVSYRYLPGYGDPTRKLYGFTAEQMARVMPELVGLDAGGLPNSVDWAGMVPVLVRAIQQQQVRIETLEGKIR